MGAADAAASHMNRGCKNLFWIQEFQKCAASYHIHQCIQGSHFMEVDLGDVCVVGRAFRFADQGIDCFCMLFDIDGNRKAVNLSKHFRIACMEWVAVLMRMSL